ncbi:hypothetical protein E4U57_006446 [Claviceps arundinis]|uniref:Uncharacterized protein n=1 Tax=Claviceps arundinis TaxID=1623583 RepID=A0ABQ7PIM7_9HYPO|nr:hypothetical protein E4U57_006446 [Claviceps arundinis]
MQQNFHLYPSLAGAFRRARSAVEAVKKVECPGPNNRIMAIVLKQLSYSGRYRHSRSSDDPAIVSQSAATFTCNNYTQCHEPLYDTPSIRRPG